MTRLYILITFDMKKIPRSIWKSSTLFRKKGKEPSGYDNGTFKQRKILSYSFKLSGGEHTLNGQIIVKNWILNWTIQISATLYVRDYCGIGGVLSTGRCIVPQFLYSRTEHTWPRFIEIFSLKIRDHILRW